MEAPTEPIPLPPEYREVGNKQNPEAFRMQVHRRRGMPVPAELGGAAESPEAAELPEDSVSVRLNTESRIPAGTYPLLDTIRRKMTGEGSGTSAAVRDYTVRCLVAAGAIPEDVYAKWKRETGLSDFRMRLFLPQAHLQRYGGDTAGTVRNAGVIFKIKMGWDACLETAETIPNQLAGLTGNGVVVVYDPPGQFMSTFARPERIRDDPYLATVSEYNLAEDRSLGLFGLSDRQLSDVPVVTIGHSRGAAAAMHEGGNSWQADNRGYVLLAPVLNQSGRDSVKSDVLLGLGTRVGDLNRLTRELAGRVGAPLLTRLFVGTASRDVKACHNLVFTKTPMPVLSAFIRRLMHTGIPDYVPQRLESGRHAVYLFDKDAFVNAHARDTLIRSLGPSDAVKILPGSHYGFSPENPGNDTAQSANLDEILRRTVAIAGRCGWKPPETGS